jgi:hypothetical protein
LIDVELASIETLKAANPDQIAQLDQRKAGLEKMKNFTLDLIDLRFEYIDN